MQAGSYAQRGSRSKRHKKERNLNMVLKDHEPEETFPRIPNNVADQLGEIQ